MLPDCDLLLLLFAASEKQTLPSAAARAPYFATSASRSCSTATTVHARISTSCSDPDAISLRVSTCGQTPLKFVVCAYDHQPSQPTVRPGSHRYRSVQVTKHTQISSIAACPCTGPMLPRERP